MLNCFLRDPSLWARPADEFDDSELDTGFAYMTDKIKSYFKTPVSLRQPAYNDGYHRIDHNGFQSTFPLQITWDLTFDTEVADTDALTADEKDQLFNIIDVLVYRGDLDDSAMESMLVGSGSTFGIYVAETLQRSVENTNRSVYPDNTNSGQPLDVRHWVAFTVTIGGEELTFKIWVSRALFLADYPHTHFEKVIYPGDPAKLVDADYSTLVDAIAELSDYIGDEARTPIDAQDHTGIYEFRSAYFPQNSALHDQVSINVLYKGATPTTASIREFIREELLARNIVTETIWREVLPDLFVNGRYFLIPMWDWKHVLPGVDLPKGIVPYSRVIAVLEAVFPSQDSAWMATVAETLVSSGSEFCIIALPDSGNDITDLSLVAEHPTYQPIDATIPHHQYQEPHTQDFNESLSAAVAHLLGASNNVAFTTDQIGGRWYLTFVANSKEYHVLNPNSYPGTI